MARVLALVPDLLFGSNVQGSLTAGGHEVELIGGAARLRERLAAGSASAEQDAGATVLVVDLTDAQLDGAALLEALAAERRLDGLRTLAFYSHVDAAVRERAEQAGFDLVVPRSRMAREGAALVARLAEDG
jgi:DNA-binding NarL/FixJ family response regulator